MPCRPARRCGCPTRARGIAQLLRWIGAEPVARILCGPTNRDHRALEVLLAAAGLPLAPVNPRPARRFAQALGLQAKTDKIDARMLAEMGLRLTPGLQVPSPKNLQHLKDLVAARRALVADRVADGNRTGGHSLALLQRLARRRRAAIEADITRIEAAIAALIAADPAPGRKGPPPAKPARHRCVLPPRHSSPKPRSLASSRPARSPPWQGLHPSPARAAPGGEKPQYRAAGAICAAHSTCRP